MVPHPPLTRFYAANADRERFVRALFDGAAAHYDATDAVFSLGSGPWYRRRVVRSLPLDRARLVLDVATGSGLLGAGLEAAIGPGGTVIGLDPSAGMLAVARTRLAGPLLQARAEALPIADGAVDLVTMGYALRHVAALDATFAEFRRVLRPGGQLLILEIARPETWPARPLARFWFRRVVPLVCGLAMPRAKAAALYGYFWETIEHCVPAATIVAALRVAGFVDIAATTQFGVLREFRATKPDTAGES